jgi:hypothetical protein
LGRKLFQKSTARTTASNTGAEKNFRGWGAAFGLVTFIKFGRLINGTHILGRGRLSVKTAAGSKKLAASGLRG